jgi:hypothetical protein
MDDDLDTAAHSSDNRGESQMRRRVYWWVWPLGLGLVVTAAAVLLALSPLLLLGLDLAFDVNWPRLSEIGQSYTAAATLLSAAALLGIVYSLRLQAKQTALLQGQLIRQFQFELLRLGMSDPLYAATVRLGGDAERSHDSFRQQVYVTQWFRYLQFSYLAGELPEATLEYELEREIFSSPAARAWWNRMRQTWVIDAENAPNGQHRGFVETVDRAFARASAAAASSPPHDASEDPVDP